MYNHIWSTFSTLHYPKNIYHYSQVKQGVKKKNMSKTPSSINNHQKLHFILCWTTGATWGCSCINPAFQCEMSHSLQITEITDALKAGVSVNVFMVQT